MQVCFKKLSYYSSAAVRAELIAKVVKVLLTIKRQISRHTLLQEQLGYSPTDISSIESSFDFLRTAVIVKWHEELQKTKGTPLAKERKYHKLLESIGEKCDADEWTSQKNKNGNNFDWYAGVDLNTEFSPFYRR